MNENMTKIIFGGIIVLLLVCFIKIKDNMSSYHNSSLSGMWSDKENSNFLYIDKKQDKDNFNKSYIVKENISKPISVKLITKALTNKEYLECKDADDIISKADINIKENKITLFNTQNKRLELYKDV